jgi:hypothetical protein
LTLETALGRSHGNFLQVIDQQREQPILRETIASAKNAGRMKRQQEAGREGAAKKTSVLVNHGYLSADEHLCSRSTETHDDFVLNSPKLRFKSRSAGADFRRPGGLMTSMPDFQHESEVLDGIGHIELRTLQARLFQCLIQYLTDRADKGFTGQV